MSGTYFMSQTVVSVRLSSPVGEAGWKVFEAQKPLSAFVNHTLSRVLFIANNNLNRFIGNLDVSRNKVRYLNVDTMIYSSLIFDIFIAK